MITVSVLHKGRPIAIQTFEDEVYLVREIFEGHEYSILPHRSHAGPRRVLDVGANVGLFAVYTKLKYPDSIVHCYEPAPNVLPLCEANTRAFADVTIHPYGLFNRDQAATLHLHATNTGQSTVHRVPGAAHTAAITLRDAGKEWDRLGWDHADVLKIDTEGCEVEILEALGPRLALVDYVLLEHHSDQDRRQIDALLGDFELFASRLYAVGLGTAKYIHRRLMVGRPRIRVAAGWPDGSGTPSQATIAPDTPSQPNAAPDTPSRPGAMQDAPSQATAAPEIPGPPAAAVDAFALGNRLADDGRMDEAIAAYEEALRLCPDWAEAHNNLATVLQSAEGRLGEAIAHYRRALALKPELGVATHRNLGDALRMWGESDAARDAYRRALLFAPEDRLLQLECDTLYPLIPASNDDIDRARAQVDATLDRCLSEPLLFDLTRLDIGSLAPPAAFIHHGRDELALRRKWARLFEGRLPSGDPVHGPVRESGRPHIGFVVIQGHEGVFLKCMRGILNHLPGDRFRLTVAGNSQAGIERMRQAITNPAVSYLCFPSRFDLALDLLRAAGFDLLHFWELGTNNHSYLLPFFRLAPVQCASWGWPVTSGIPAIDDYLSAELLEPEDGQRHYSERLVRLRHLPTYYYRPSAPASLKSRAEMGFGRHDHVYLCQQNLRKVQPDFDAIVAAILRRDPRGRVLFIEDRHAPITDLLRVRLQRGIPDVVDRVRIIPRMPEADYLNLVAVADVVLDTLHYGGGANTVYDALAVGTPIVTLPGRFHRGRWAYAAYQRIGVTDGIADSEDAYVEIALRLGSDSDYRKDLSDRITAACPVLFEDRGAVDELAAFFESAVHGVIGE